MNRRGRTLKELNLAAKLPTKGKVTNLEWDKDNEIVAII